MAHSVYNIFCCLVQISCTSMFFFIFKDNEGFICMIPWHSLSKSKIMKLFSKSSHRSIGHICYWCYFWSCCQSPAFHIFWFLTLSPLGTVLFLLNSISTYHLLNYHILRHSVAYSRLSINSLTFSIILINLHSVRSFLKCDFLNGAQNSLLWPSQCIIHWLPFSCNQCLIKCNTSPGGTREAIGTRG